MERNIIVTLVLLILVSSLTVFQMQKLIFVSAQTVSWPTLLFGNITRDGHSAPIGTNITAWNISGAKLYVRKNIVDFKMGEYGTAEGSLDPMEVYNGSGTIIFKINGFTAIGNETACTSLCLPKHLDISCTNCNNPPTLANASVDKSSGNTSTTFNYSVVYSDADNDAPIWVNLTIDNNVSYKMNGNYSNATQPDELKNSRVYWYETTLGRGDHTYKYTAYDGFNTSETSIQEGPTIYNIPPGLTNGKVTPTVGNNFNTYNFSVIYTDYDNDTPVYINVTIVGSTASYAMNETNSSDNDVTDGKGYYYLTTLNPGYYSFYFITSDGYNVTQSSTRSGPNVGKLYNTTKNISANIPTLVNATSEVNVSLEIVSLQNITNASINITLFMANPLNATFSIPGLGKYMKIDISSELNASLTSLMLRVYYTQEEIEAQHLNESSLTFYWYNESLLEWMILNETWDWVFGTGVDTTNINEYSGNVWANLSHLSYFKIGGEVLIIPFTIPLQEGWNLISIPLEVV